VTNREEGNLILGLLALTFMHALVMAHACASWSMYTCIHVHASLQNKRRRLLQDPRLNSAEGKPDPTAYFLQILLQSSSSLLVNRLAVFLVSISTSALDSGNRGLLATSNERNAVQLARKCINACITCKL